MEVREHVTRCLADVARLESPHLLQKQDVCYILMRRLEAADVRDSVFREPEILHRLVALLASLDLTVDQCSLTL